MPNIQKYAAAGWDSLQWAYRSADGWIAGAANLTAADTGDSSAMARYQGARTFTFALPQNTPLAVTGDDGLIATFLFSSVDPVAFSFTTSVMDMVFKAATENMDIVTDGEWEYSPVTTESVDRAPLVLLLSRQLKSTPGSVKGYEHLELFSTEVAYLGNNREFQAAPEHNWQVTANPSSVLPDGRTVAAVHPDAPNGTLIGRIFTSEKRFSYATLIGNATLDKIVTPHAPISTAKAKATVATAGVFAADTVTGVVTTAPYGVEVTTVPANGQPAICRFEFNNFSGS